MFGLINKVAASGMGAAAMAMLNDTAIAQTSLGSNQATAHETSTAYVEYTTVGANTGAILDNGNVGDGQVIWNNSANSLNVYPTVGGTINTLGTNAAFSLGAGQLGLFKRLTASKWAGGALASPTSALTVTDLTVTNLNKGGAIVFTESTGHLVNSNTFTVDDTSSGRGIVISGTANASGSYLLLQNFHSGTGPAAVNLYTDGTGDCQVRFENQAGALFMTGLDRSADKYIIGEGTFGTDDIARFSTGLTELVGTLTVGSSTLSTTSGGLIPPIQVQGTGAASGGLIIGNWGNNASIPHLFFTKSRGGSVGAHGAVLLGDTLGRINCEASDGSALGVAGQVRWVATENWSGTNQGSGTEFTATSTAQIGATRALVLAGSDAGGPFVGVGSPFNITTPILPAAMLHVASAASGASAGRSEIRLQRGSGDTTAPIFSVYKNRGNGLASPVAINAGDDIAQFNFFGYVGSTGLFVEGARIFVDEIGAIANNSTGLGMLIEIHTRLVGGSLLKQFTFTDTGMFVGFNATGGIGYTTGAGGTVTQATNKSTGVTLNKVTGEITMNAAALAGDTTVSFVLTNSAIVAGDYLSVQHVSAGTVGSYKCEAVCAGGTATITVRNITTGSLSEAIVLKFMLFKSATA